VVGPRKVRYLKGDQLRAEVGSTPEC
jgi:hypothetical protein